MTRAARRGRLRLAARALLGLAAGRRWRLAVAAADPGVRGRTTRSTRSRSTTRCSQRRAAGHGDDRLAVRRQLRPARHRALLRHPGAVRRRARTRSTRSPTSTSTAPIPAWRPSSASGTTRPRTAARCRLRLRIGDPDETISAATATYVISYDVKRRDAHLQRLRRVLLGRHRLREPADQAGRRSPPGARRRPGRSLLRRPAAEHADLRPADDRQTASATFGQANLPPGRGSRSASRSRPGLVADNAPHLEPDGSKLTSGERLGAIVLGAPASVAVLIGSPLVGVLWWRKNGRDQRYAGLAPGTTPLAGQTGAHRAQRPGHRRSRWPSRRRGSRSPRRGC